MYKRNNQHRTSLEFLVEAGRLDWVTKKLKYFIRCRSTILVKNLWNRNCFSWIVSKISYIHYSHLCSQLTCAPLLPLCWAMHILEHWDDCSTQINIGEGETHASEHSRFLTSIIEEILANPLNEWWKHKLLGVVRGCAPREIFWMLTPQSPLSWVSESFIKDIYWLSKLLSRFQVGKFFVSFKIH